MAAIPYKKITPPPARTMSGTRPAVNVGKAASSIPPPNPARVEVELNVFADRSNPRWLLARARADVLLANLPTDSSLVPTQLTGYRGFTVRVSTDASARTIHVFHNKELERWLLESARFYLTPDLISWVEKQLH